jgi:hypothetical protein
VSRFAKMDASAASEGFSSGTYRLVPAASEGFAKMDVWTVELTVLSKTCADFADPCPGLQREDAIGSRAPPW